jgi:hypothetical protein
VPAVNTPSGFPAELKQLTGAQISRV